MKGFCGFFGKRGAFLVATYEEKRTDFGK